LEFACLLVRNPGDVQELAADLDIAYTTARNRLDEIVAALGVPVESADGGQERERRTDVLRRLSAGEIEFDEAKRLLKE